MTASKMLDDRIEEFSRLFRITLSEQLHRSFQVGKKNSDLLALAF
jgi:hypothetical protein